jgi:hypothetical protein
MHAIQTLFGLARLRHTNDKGMPDPLQLATFGREFSDTVQFRRPPPQVQRVMFALLSAVARSPLWPRPWIDSVVDPHPASGTSAPGKDP